MTGSAACTAGVGLTGRSLRLKRLHLINTIDLLERLLTLVNALEP